MGQIIPERTRTMSLAQITLIGNTGRDPEMSYTPNGIAVTKFSLAVSHKQGDKEITTWYNCSAWRALAEMIHTHLKKGQQVFVQGELLPREYTTREGQTRTSLDVTVNVFQFLGSKQQRDSTSSDEAEPLDLDEHPF
jgi:single-strand DNA-binding protein